MLEMSYRHSILLPPLRDLLLSPNHQPHPLVLKGHLKLAAWMTNRQNLLTGGISEDTANLRRSHSWRKGSAGAYYSAWKQWSSWCGQREADPFCSTVASTGDYLTELFKKGRSYHTIYVHRSANSAFHRPIDGVKVGQHDR